MKLNIREIEDDEWDVDPKVAEWPHNWEWEGRFQRSSGRLKPWKLSANSRRDIYSGSKKRRAPIGEGCR
jgi:hypothetical protein